jgi:DNA-directed RNA polymerase specialized sigma24 family protein
MNTITFSSLRTELTPAIHKMAGYVSRLTHTDAEDAEQELSLAIWGALQKYSQTSTASVRSFAYLCMRSRARELLRSGRSLRRSLVQSSDTVEDTASDLRYSPELVAGVKMLNDKVEARLSRRALSLYRAVKAGYSLAEFAKAVRMAPRDISRLWNEAVVPVVEAVAG